MLDKTKFAHFTVPHSGTRYINKAVEAAIGEQAYQVATPKQYARTEANQTNQKFVFCHIGQRWGEWIETICEQPHIKTWITVRSPIHTWGTHFGHILNHNEQQRIQPVYEKLGQMREQYIALMELAPKVGYIHRVDMDDLSGLSEYLGLDLKEHDQQFSNTTPMKQALRERDLNKMQELCKGTEFFSAFRDYTTPDIKDFFEELGYDIWWYNGQRNAA